MPSVSLATDRANRDFGAESRPAQKVGELPKKSLALRLAALERDEKGIRLDQTEVQFLELDGET